MRKLVHLLSFVLTAAAIGAPALPAESLENSIENERAAVQKVVTDAYVDGIHNFRDPAAIRAGFHPDFEMLFLKDGELEKVPLAKWIAGIEARNAKEPPPPRTADAPRPTTAEFARIDVTGTAASCRVEISRGGKHLFTDYLALYKFADGWKIVGKSYYRHPEG